MRPVFVHNFPEMVILAWNPKKYQHLSLTAQFVVHTAMTQVRVWIVQGKMIAKFRKSLIIMKMFADLVRNRNKGISHEFLSKVINLFKAYAEYLLK